MNSETSQPLIVSSLICHRDVPMALKCLGSLLKHSQEPIRFLLHDDGSLQDKDIEVLSQHLCLPRIVAKKEADEQMAEVLAKYPAALKFRQHDVLAKKLLDCVHFNNSESFAYCDTDIYFFRPFTGLFAFPSQDTNALMMRDMTHSYCMRSWQMLRHKLLQVPQNPNSGLLCYRRSCYDLDFIEWFLSKPELRSVPYFVEQTAWSLLSWRASCRLWDPKQIAFMTPQFVPGKQFIAGHFVKTYRSVLDDYANATLFHTEEAAFHTEEAARIETVPAKLCTPAEYAFCELQRPFVRAFLGPKL